MMPRWLAPILLLAVGGGPPSGPVSPVAPEGYRWADCDSMRGRFLVPPGWHFRQEEKDGTAACFISEQEIVAGTEFETGITINRWKDIPGRTGVAPEDYALLFADRLLEGKEVLDSAKLISGPFRAVGAEFVDGAAEPSPLQMYVLLLANPQTGTLYMVIFESPRAIWPEKWPLAKPVIESLGFDTEE